MKTIACTVGQSLFLLVVGLVLGLAVNSVRGKSQIKISRDYFRSAQAAATAPAGDGLSEGRPDGTSSTEPATMQGFQVATLEEVIKIFEDPKAQYGAYVFVDARADEPYRAGHIPGAVQCDYYRSEYYLPSVVSRVLGAEKVVVYCNGGECEDSLYVCHELLNNAVPRESILLFKGGWEAWSKAGLPHETGSE